MGKKPKQNNIENIPIFHLDTPSDLFIKLMKSLQIRFQVITIKDLQNLSSQAIIIAPYSGQSLCSYTTMAFIYLCAKEVGLNKMISLVSHLHVAIPFPCDEAQLALAIQYCRCSTLANQESNIKHKAVRDELDNSRQGMRAFSIDYRAGQALQKRLAPPPLTTYQSLRVESDIIPSLYLSGDFINYQFVLNNYFLFSFIDVSGHGASSAFVTVMVKQLMDNVIAKHIYKHATERLDDAPQGFLECINRFLIELNLEKHLTAVVGNLNLKTRILRYANAAHVPLPVVVNDDEVSTLSLRGKPLGLYEDYQWQVGSVQLGKRYSLYCLSDGIFDLLPQHTNREKEAYLLQQMGRHGYSPSDMRTLINFNKNIPLADDICMLMVNYQT